MPLRSDWSDDRCPIARSLQVLGDPWTLLVLRQQFLGVRRFEELKEQLGVSDAVLSSRLAALVDAGLLDRVAYKDAGRTRHEYVLTPAGADTFSVVTSLALWGERHRPHPDEAVRMEVVHRPCGHNTQSADVCSHCGGPVTTETAVWRRTWNDPTDSSIAEASPASANRRQHHS